MKHNPNECANCGADQRPGSTLCEDCIIACGGGTGILPGDHGIFINYYKSGRNVVEVDIAYYRYLDFNKVIKIQLDSCKPCTRFVALLT